MKFSYVNNKDDKRPKAAEMSVDEFEAWLCRDRLPWTLGETPCDEKDGEAFIPAVFKKGGKRRKADVLSMTALVLDVDHGHEDPKSIAGLFKHKGFCYSTYSSTKESPRIRLVIPYPGDPVDLEVHDKAWCWANEICGGRIDPESRDPSRLYFKPRYPTADAFGASLFYSLGTADLLPNVYASKWDRHGAQEEYWKDREFDCHRMAAQLKGEGKSQRQVLAGCSAFQGVFYGEREKRYDADELRTIVQEVFDDGVEGRPAGERDSKGKLYPNVIGRKVLKGHRVVRDRLGTCFEYDGRCWNELTPPMLERYAFEYDDEWATTKGRRAEVASFVMASTQAMEEIPWGGVDDDEIPCWSGVINISKKNLRAHRKDDWLEMVIPHTWMPGAKCEVWYKALAEWFRGDPLWKEKMLALQEFFGYCLMPHAKYKKALVCYGEPDTGKSIVLSTLTELVGVKNTISISVEDMDDPRKVAPIRGKALNVISDLTSRSMIADGGFKRLVSTGDAVLLDRKYGMPELYVPFCKHAVATNALPGVSDKSWATFSRMLLIRFPRPVRREDQNRELLQEIKAEMSGILLWSLLGAMRLLEQKGQFTVIEESEELLRKYRSDQNPVNDFLGEKCVMGEEVSEDYSRLYVAFQEWYGRRHVTRNQLTRWLNEAGYETSRKREDGKMSHRVLGARLLVSY